MSPPLRLICHYIKYNDNLTILFTTKLCKKIIITKTIIGDRSKPEKLRGIQERILYNTGSVTPLTKRTIGLKGSGLTQDKMALAITIHKKQLKVKSKILAKASRK